MPILHKGRLLFYCSQPSRIHEAHPQQRTSQEDRRVYQSTDLVTCQILISMSKEEWCDQCTSIKPSDPQYQLASKLVVKSGCNPENLLLTECLNQHRKDWSKCQVPTQLLLSNPHWHSLPVCNPINDYCPQEMKSHIQRHTIFMKLSNDTFESALSLRKIRIRSRLR